MEDYFRRSIQKTVSVFWINCFLFENSNYYKIMLKGNNLTNYVVVYSIRGWYHHHSILWSSWHGANTTRQPRRLPVTPSTDWRLVTTSTYGWTSGHLPMTTFHGIVIWGWGFTVPTGGESSPIHQHLFPGDNYRYKYTVLWYRCTIQMNCKSDVIVWPKVITQLLPEWALGWQLFSNIAPPKQPCLLSPTRGGKGNARLDSLAIYHRCSHLLETVYKLHPLRCRLYADYCIY